MTIQFTLLIEHHVSHEVLLSLLYFVQLMQIKIQLIYPFRCLNLFVTCRHCLPDNVVYNNNCKFLCDDFSLDKSAIVNSYKLLIKQQTAIIFILFQLGFSFCASFSFQDKILFLIIKSNNFHLNSVTVFPYSFIFQFSFLLL